MRTNYCGDLRKSDVGTAVHLFGWVQKRRDLGGLVFIDMRDRGELSRSASIRRTQSL